MLEVHIKNYLWNIKARENSLTVDGFELVDFHIVLESNII